MIRVIAICVFRRGNSILVSEGIDPVSRQRFARPLGGAVEDGEHSRDAVAREVREEIGQEVTDLRLLGELENRFTYQGRPGHDIVFIYDGRFLDDSLYDRPQIPICEPGWTTPALCNPSIRSGRRARSFPRVWRTYFGKLLHPVGRICLCRACPRPARDAARPPRVDA